MTGRGWVLPCALALAGCGSGATSLEAGVGGTGGASFEGTVVLARAAVVEADVDGDGRADLVAVDRDGTGDSKCWRNLGDGAYAEVPASWAGAAGAASVHDACDGQDDASLLDGLGVHRAGEGAAGEALPYAVLHVGEGAGDPAGFPALDGVEPTSGSPGTLVALEGQGLAARGAPPSVTFGGVAAQVLFAFPDYVLVAVPAGAPLGLDDVVLVRSGLASIPIPFSVVVAPDPVIASVVPGSVTVGTVAVIHGENLGGPLSRVEVSFAGTPAARVLALSGAVVAVVPEGAVSGPVTVTVDGRASNAVFVTVGALPAPSISGLTPAFASAGSLVRIEGSDLSVIEEELVVTFAGARAAILGLDFGAGAGSLTVVVPADARDGDVVVTVGGRASASVPFRVVTRGTPRIDAVEPSPAAAGEMISIRGPDLVDLSAWRPGARPPVPLLGDLHVTVGGKEAWFVLPAVDGLRVMVPDGAASGAVVVRVDGLFSDPFPFSVR